MAFNRSAESLAFEQMWRSLGHTGPIPGRRAFEPRLARPFRRHLLLAQAHSLGDASLRVRFAGYAVRMRFHQDILGMDFLGLLPEPERKARALDLVREMFEAPCGLRFVAPAHYEGAFSHFWDVTAFPLAAEEDSPAMIAALAQPMNPELESNHSQRKVLSVGMPIQLDRIPIARISSG